MSRLASFFLGVLAGATLLHAAMNYHVIRAGDGFHMVAKQPARLSEAYVDIRDFSVADWPSHPQLASAIVQADKQYLIGGSAAGTVQETVNQLLPTWPQP